MGNGMYIPRGEGPAASLTAAEVASLKKLVSRGPAQDFVTGKELLTILIGPESTRDDEFYPDGSIMALVRNQTNNNLKERGLSGSDSLVDKLTRLGELELIRATTAYESAVDAIQTELEMIS